MMSVSRPRALLSVYDKSGIVEMAGFLAGLGLELVSSGGTAAHLREAGLEVRDVSDVTGFPEILDGRVKTLHPAIHGGVLARGERKEDLQTIAELDIAPVQWVVVNLYPFIEELGTPKDEAAQLEFIDIGGPALLRAAAKNFRSVVVLCDPSDYGAVRREWAEGGEIFLQSRRRLAAKVFRLTSAYDEAVAGYLEGEAPALQFAEKY